MSTDKELGPPLWKRPGERKYNGSGSRMNRRDHSAVIGFCASLVVHVGIAASMLHVYVRDMDKQRWWPRISERAHADGMVFRDGEFGESKGRGEALNSLAGLEPFVGRLGPQDQAPLSRDPVGNGELADDPKMKSALKEGADAPLPESVVADQGDSAPFGVGDVAQNAAPAVVAKPPIKAIAIEEKGAEAEPVKVAIAPQRQQQQQAPNPLPGVPGRGEKAEHGGGGAAGDPAPMSESESDAFSRMGSISVRNGRVEARLGRNFKSVKPRLSLKGELDAISIAKPIVEMKVLVDESGRVIDVKVLRSSGSNEIDLPTTTAMYKWWIEPARDRQGKAIKDVILVTFSYL
jgi:TonB family protein